MIRIHEGAWPVVNGLTADRRIVRIHHAVNKPDELPCGHELGLGIDHVLEHGKIRPLALFCLRVMPLNHVIGESANGIYILPAGKKLKRAHSDMTLGDARQHCTGQRPLTADHLAGGHGSKRAGGRYTQRVHGFAHDILAQHRPEHGAAIAVSRERRAPTALELHVTAYAVIANHLAEQNSPAITQLRRPAAKLKPRVGHSQRLGIGR